MLNVGNFSTVCIIWLVSLIGFQNVFAQKNRFSTEEKEIYAKAQAALKFDNAYFKRFEIDSRLFSCIRHCANGTKVTIINYIRENNWWFYLGIA
jgi:hypothetical protein